MTVSEKLRLVQGLHSHAEMFGFDWDDGSDWTWHDVACKIADEVDAENAKLRELANAVKEFIEDVNCSECPMMGDCDDNNVIACHEELSFHTFHAMYKRAVEVDG